MLFAADYPFMSILWTMIVFFAWVAWFWMIIIIFGDVFRRRDIGGFAKAAWCVFLIVVPFLGALIYLIAQHKGMTDRQVEDAQRATEAFDARVRAAARPDGSGAAAEIEKAKQLLDAGAIDRDEFQQLKARVLV